MFVHLDKLLALTTISRVLKVIPLIPGQCVLHVCLSEFVPYHFETL